MTTTVTKPIEEVFEIIVSALNEWKAEQTEEHIKKTVFSKLNASKDEILLKLLGFDIDYGSQHFKLDHCNGRAGNSAAGDYLRNVQSAAIKKWLSNIYMPILPDKDLTRIQKQASMDYIKEFKERAKELAKIKARQDAEAFICEHINTDVAQNYFKTIQLLSSEELEN